MVIAYLKITDGRQHLELQRNEIEGFALAKGFEVNKWVMEVVDDKRKEKESTLKVLLIFSICSELRFQFIHCR